MSVASVEVLIVEVEASCVLASAMDTHSVESDTSGGSLAPVHVALGEQ